MLVPVCRVGHWFLLIINLHRRSVVVVDSKRKHGASEKAKIVEPLLLLLELIHDIFEMPKFDWSEWSWTDEDELDRQRNYYDCGVFVFGEIRCRVFRDVARRPLRRNIVSLREDARGIISAAPDWQRSQPPPLPGAHRYLYFRSFAVVDDNVDE